MTENQFYEYLYQQKQRSKAMSEWQAIQSAPKDGTLFLAFTHSYGRYVCFYDKSVVGGNRRWQVYPQNHCLECGSFSIEPTHWQPLPKPPTE